MVFPNFFITFVRHSFHASPPLHIPLSRERASPCTVLPPGTTLPSWHTRCLTRHAPRKRLRTRDSLTRCTSQRAMSHALLSLTAHTPPHTTTLAKGYAHALLSLTAHTPSTLPPPQRAMPRTRPTRKMPQYLPLQPLLSKKKERASTTKILHITILHVTFTRIGVKTTQKSEAIFSFID